MVNLADGQAVLAVVSRSTLELEVKIGVLVNRVAKAVVAPSHKAVKDPVNGLLEVQRILTEV
jgi:hypothetical protein